MNPFVLNNLEDVRKFCLESGLEFPQKGNTEYTTIMFRTFVWKVLRSNQILHLIDVGSADYMDNIKSRTISKELREKIWKFTLPICAKLKEYSAAHFKPSDVYLTMTNNGDIKEEIGAALKYSGAHSWTAYILPTTEKFWVRGDFPFSLFLERISGLNIPEDWWDFQQTEAPRIIHD